VTQPLSVLIVTKNEERNIGLCLDAIAGWADDIVVLDSGSTDRTLELCAERGVPTTFRAYVDHRSQLQWALSSIPWKHEWLLLLDADHVVTPALRNQIAEMLRSDRGDVHAYYTPHDNYFRNRPVRGLKADYLQLVRRGHVRMDESELVDFRFVVDGPIGRLAGAIRENNQNELDIDFWIDKHQRFARRMAMEEVLRANGLLAWSGHLRPRLFGNPDERMIWLKNVWYRLPLYVRPGLFFLYRYVGRLGFLDGWNGFVYHALQTFWFRLLVDVHIAEFRTKLASGEITIDDIVAAAGLTRRAAPDSGNRTDWVPQPKP
jgi:glycosyltransferase involved in cell wall biosynthesis